jgi:hypothetical protein
MIPYQRLFESIHNIHVRNQKAWKIFRDLFPNTPEYVVLAFYEAFFDNTGPSADIVKNSRYTMNPVRVLTSNWHSEPESEELVELLNGKWERKILNVTFADFSLETQQMFLDREFGHLNPHDVPRDKERLEYQLKNLKADGLNEPIVVAESSTGYDLYEGFHRTMALLQLGDGLPVKINAWVRLAD